MSSTPGESLNPTSALPFEGFLRVEDKFDEVRGWQLAKAALYSANRSLKLTLCVTFLMLVVGLIVYIGYVAIGITNAWAWVVLALIGSGLTGFLYTMSVERLWLKHLGLLSRPSGRRWFEQLQALRFAQLLDDDLKDRAVRTSLLEWVDAEFQGQAPVLGVQPLVLALVALAIGVICVWLSQADVWATGVGYVLLIVVFAALIVLTIIPEIITAGHRRRELLKALIRRLP